MSVILDRLRRTARDDDVPLGIIGEIDVDQRSPLLLPKRFLFSGCGFPDTFRGLGSAGDLGFKLGECGQRSEQQDGEEGESEFH